jgi:hypothetical protein
MKLLLSILAFGFPFTAGAAGLTRFKTFNQLFSSTDFYVTCTGRGAGAQVNFSFHYGWSMAGGMSVSGGGLSVASPSEALLVHEYGQNVFTLAGAGTSQVTLTGGVGGTHNDAIQLTFRDATNGRFPGTLSYKELSSGYTFTRDVVCGGTNYTLPHP